MLNNVNVLLFLMMLISFFFMSLFRNFLIFYLLSSTNIHAQFVFTLNKVHVISSFVRFWIHTAHHLRIIVNNKSLFNTCTLWFTVNWFYLTWLLYLLMLYLIVQMTSEPVVKQAWFHITWRIQLKAEPIFGMVKVYLIWNMRHLGTPDKPVTFYGPEKKTWEKELLNNLLGTYSKLCL